MNSKKKTVIVLGNGFTKAFIPEMPLVKEGFEVGTLLDKFNETSSPGAHFILKKATESEAGGKLVKINNIEVLMTRLDNLMPYDFNRKVVQELELLYHELKKSFVKQIKNVISESLKISKGELPEIVCKFANHCITNEIDCVTSNYDDLLKHYMDRGIG